MLFEAKRRIVGGWGITEAGGTFSATPMTARKHLLDGSAEPADTAAFAFAQCLAGQVVDFVPPVAPPEVEAAPPPTEVRPATVRGTFNGADSKAFDHDRRDGPGGGPRGGLGRGRRRKAVAPEPAPE